MCSRNDAPRNRAALIQEESSSGGGRTRLVFVKEIELNLKKLLWHLFLKKYSLAFFYAKTIKKTFYFSCNFGVFNK